ncbi:MAG: ABC transporter permease [Gemmatimonadaceae bacterium]|nr:ABC transporter permease [Gemmatimonadaceae bacterium]
MHLLDAIRLAFQTLRVQKLKSFFTLVGVTIGVMFLIAVVSIVEGMGSYMENDFVAKLIGTNTFQLRRFPSISDASESEWREWVRRPRITFDDAKEVAAALPPGAMWSVESSDNIAIESRFSRPRELEASAVDGDYFRIRNMEVAQGRLISPQELALGSRVVVIGQEIATRFFPRLNPIGRTLKVGGTSYEVIGVAAKQGSIFGISLDRFVIAPASSPLQRIVNPHGLIDGMKVKMPTTEGMFDTRETVRQVMRARHKLRPSQPDNFVMETSESALEFWKKIEGNLVIAGVILPAIALIVGALVIMNIMLVAVSERTREIGIRKAIGAKYRDILAQFLVEATTLSIIGAAIGVALGIILSQAIAALSPLPASVAPWSIITGILVGAGVGVVAGVYPASRAARLDPIVALRAE